jgi:hypothetical protein
VKWAFKFAALLAGVLLLAGPLMACMLPGSSMTTAEKECCRKMAGQCGGQSGMPISHGCCVTVVRPEHVPLATNQLRLAHNVVTVALVVASDQPICRILASPFSPAPDYDHPPPFSDLASLQTLRI